MSNNDKALDSFIESKQQIDRILKRLQEASDDHFYQNPDDIGWCQASELRKTANDLQLVSDWVFQEGENAPEQQ